MKLSDIKDYKVVGSAQSRIAVEEPRRKDLLETASDVGGFLFPGTKQIGESLGVIAAAGGRALKGDMQGANDILDTQVPIPSLIGAYTAAGASALGSGGAGIGKGLVSGAARSAGIGGAIGGGSAVAEGKPTRKVVESTLGGAAVGAGVSVAFSGGEQLLKGFRALPQRLVRSATGQSKNEILAGKDISRYVIENRKIGTAEQLISQSQKAIEKADDIIKTGLAGATDKSVPVKDIIKDIADSINAAGGDADERAVRSILSSLAPQVKKTLAKPQLTLAEANMLRSQLDKTLGNRAFISTQLPYNKGVLMDFTNAVREQVKGLAPAGVRPAFVTLSKEITLRDLLIKKAAGASRNQIIGLGDLISGGAGGVVGGIPGALVGAGVKRVAESTIAKTATASIISRLDTTLSPILATLEPAAQTAVINAIIQALNESQEEPLQEQQ